MQAERDQPADDGMERRPRRRGRFLLLLVLALIAVAGGAWGWTVYGKRLGAMFSAPVAGGGGVPVVRADPAPTKVRPSDPGGMDVPDRDKLVYERLQGESGEKRVERLLPAPETPMVPPRAAQRPAPEATQKLPRVPTEAQVKAAVKPAPPPFVREPAASEPSPEDSPPSSAETAPEEPTPEAVAEAKPDPKPEPKPASAPAAQTPPASARAAQTQTASAPAAQTPPASAPAAQPSPASAASIAPGYLIQIAAVREPERAESEWGRLQRQHPDTLRGLKLFVVRADLGDKGVFWRLRAGPFADEAAAKTRCADLAKRKVGCMVVKAGG